MRFKRGSKVEVLKEANTLTAWCGAEIISGKGQSYTVRYDHYVPEHGEVSERVHRNLVRPRPPVQKVESWVAGDAVEVFDDIMWRVAIISRVGGSYCMVRLLGSSYKFGVHISNIRVRQCWQNDEWVLMFKGSGNSGELEFSQLSTSDCYKEMSLQEAQTPAAVKNQEKGDLSAARYIGVQGSHIAYSRTLKRTSPYCSSLIQANSGNVKKFRAAEKEDRRHPGLPVNVDQVDAVAYPRKNMGEKYMCASFNNITNGYNELDRREINDFVGCSVARDTDSNDSDSNISSVGSCSAISRTLNKFSTQMLAVLYQEANSLTSDAESCCGGSRDEEICDLHPEESIAETLDVISCQGSSICVNMYSAEIWDIVVLYIMRFQKGSKVELSYKFRAYNSITFRQYDNWVKMLGHSLVFLNTSKHCDSSALSSLMKNQDLGIFVPEAHVGNVKKSWRLKKKQGIKASSQLK
ncbi:ENT domain-containing protein [Heracleum sosnowskyi]|uniref:ENT domain-containing protein n=1 Tax=Heracleum sosnowskyi TaxID=360622 RepID=A0AAD8N4R5_9APIA|nr:ENT domain-containing protein [Heracleum sosnowskyi]